MQEDILIQISNRITDLRREKGITVQELADKTDVSKGLISRIDQMAKPVDAICLECSAAKRAGSIPVLGTKAEKSEILGALQHLRPFAF